MNLADQLAADDAAEDAGMHPDDRLTCHTHQCWAEDCATHPMHTQPLTYAITSGTFRQ